MLSRTKTRAVVGLDIEAGSIAATEVTSNGSGAVTGFGIMPLEAGIFREGEVADADALGEVLKSLFSQHKLSKSVRIGVANQRVAVRSLQLPAIEDKSELETAIRFQAQDHIPMPLEQAVLDWQVVARNDEAGERRMDVVAVAARRDMLAGVVDAAEGAGLRPVGIDVSAFGMIRALAVSSSAGPGFAAMDGPAVAPAKLYCNLGDVTNLAVARGVACLFTRVSPYGMEGIAQKLAERRQLTLEHAREWLVHVGLSQPPESVEGERETVTAVREVLADGVSRLADELRLSLDFYAAQEGSVMVEGAVACGPGTRIPGLVDAIQAELGLAFEIARPRGLSHLDDDSAARLTVSYGLALEE
jgi:type IV pilus assembly protein PilM